VGSAVIAALVFLMGALAMQGTVMLHAQDNEPWNSPHVAKVIAEGCSQEPIQRTQSGFRVRGKAGIVTALHGVAGCRQISAIPGGGQPAITELSIEEVDVGRDVALLQRMAAPLEPTAGLDWEPELRYDGLSVIGYPYGIPSQLRSRQLQLREPPKVALRDLLPPSTLEALRPRNSPDVSIQVLSIEGHIMAGHSGAPLLNASERVVGIANGGLKGGSTGLTWAIPWTSIEWKPVALATADLARIADLLPPVVFTFPGNAEIPGEDGDIQRVDIVLVSSEQVVESIKTRQVAEVKDDHPVVAAPHSRNYEIYLDADAGALFTGCRFDASFALSDSGRSCNVTSEGKQIVLRFTLESGPVYDRYRGMLEGTLVGMQRRVLPRQSVTLEKQISTHRRSDYLLSLPADFDVARVQEVLITQGPDRVIAQGGLGQALAAADALHEFRLVYSNNVLILTVAPRY